MTNESPNPDQLRAVRSSLALILMAAVMLLVDVRIPLPFVEGRWDLFSDLVGMLLALVGVFRMPSRELEGPQAHANPYSSAITVTRVAAFVGLGGILASPLLDEVGFAWRMVLYLVELVGLVAYSFAMKLWCENAGLEKRSLAFDRAAWFFMIQTVAILGLHIHDGFERFHMVRGIERQWLDGDFGLSLPFEIALAFVVAVSIPAIQLVAATSCTYLSLGSRIHERAV